MLVEKGANVTYSDPYIPRFDTGQTTFDGLELSAHALGEADLVLIVTDHSNVDYDVVLKESKLVVDTRNAIKSRTEKVWRI